MAPKLANRISISICDELSFWNGTDTYLNSPAPKFLETWLGQHRHKGDYDNIHDFIKFFIGDVLSGEEAMECDAVKGCKNYPFCADVVRDLRVDRTAENVAAVYYNIRAMVDFFKISQTVYAVMANMENHVQAMIPKIVHAFSWHYNAEVEKGCKEEATQLLSLLQAVILFALLMIGTIAGGALASLGGPAVAGQAGSAAGAGGAGATTAAGEASKVTGVGGPALGSNILASVNTALGSVMTSNMDWLQDSICRKHPHPGKDDEQATVERALEVFGDLMAYSRSDVVQTVLQLKEDGPELLDHIANNQTLPFSIIRGGTALSTTQDQNIQHVEYFERDLTTFYEYMMSIWVMHKQLGGAYCSKNPNGKCGQYDKTFKTVCVVPDQGIECEAASWLKWHRDPNLVQLFGEPQIEDGRWGYNYDDLLTQSYENHRQNGLDRVIVNWQDLTREYVDTGKIDPKRALVLPVCWSDGTYLLPNVGEEPPQEGKDFKPLKGEDKMFGCSCGLNGGETLKFWDAIGLYGTSYQGGVLGLCEGMAQRWYSQNSPVTSFLSFCDMRPDFDPDCQHIQEEYDSLRKDPTQDDKAAACHILAYSDSWQQASSRSYFKGAPNWAKHADQWMPSAECLGHWKQYTEKIHFHCIDSTRDDWTVLDDMNELVANIDDREVFSNDIYIVLAWKSDTGKAFAAELHGLPDVETDGLTKSGTITGAEVKRLIRLSYEKCAADHHGAEIPVTYPDVDDGKKGILTIEHVDGNRGCGMSGASLCLHDANFQDPPPPPPTLNVFNPDKRPALSIRWNVPLYKDSRNPRSLVGVN